MNIHERIIARLENLRQFGPPLIKNGVDIAPALIDMAIDDVRRKCPNCGDAGERKSTSMFYAEEEITVKCYCDRPAYLEECERRLNGTSNG